MQGVSWVLARISNNPSTLLDLAAVTLIVYWLLSVFRGTRATMLVRGVIILWLTTALLGTVFQLTTLTWLIRNSGIALLVGIPVIFQPELRRALEQLGRTGAYLTRARGRTGNLASTIDAIVEACAQFSRQHTGALIVIERQTGLQEYADRGVPLDAEVTSPLIAGIFYPNSPLHDAAIIIRGARIVAASAVLPLTDQVLGAQHYGTRHRAALGISEHSDAVAVVVSEEQGTIGVATNGRLVTNLTPERLRAVLAGLLGITLPAEAT
ncbi:MAG TPA: diadenylate cyclase CdaA [Chloroflexia bacterium]|nr:diadenylate cyclase CdaA [Chloroflexia bacterium]